MKFYKEVWGIIWEFNSIKEYFSFVLGRLTAWAIIIGFLYWWFFM